MNILVLHPGALGDIILSLPALRILRERFAGARITLAANVDFAEPVAAGLAHAIRSLASFPLHRLYRDELPLKDAPFWRRYDRIVCWTGSGDQGFARNFARLHPDVLVECWKPGRGEKRHVSEIFAAGLRSWVGDCAPISPFEIGIAPAELQSGTAWMREHGWSGQRQLIALHFGAGSPEKRWPLPRFRSLSEILRHNSDLLLIEGPAEPGLLDKSAIAGNGIVCARNLPLRLLASLMKQCRLFIGNDSGIAHFAAALQVPCVVLFGPTNPAHWAPAGPHVSILKTAGPCPACLQLSATHHRCLDSISIDDVLSAVR